MEKEMTVVRIYLREADHGRQRGLLEEIMAVLHDEMLVHGVTVFRGIAGFGQHGQVHSADLLRLGVHLPLVVEFFDEPETVDSAIAALREIVPSGHLIRWNARCEVS